MNHFVIVSILSLCGFFVFTSGFATDRSIDSSVDKHPVVAGAARQIFGSSSLRTNVNNKQTRRRRTTTPKPRFSDEYDDDDYSDRYHHGVLITEPRPPHVPFDPSFRNIGGHRVSGIETEIYGPRKHGERDGDIEDEWTPWDRFDTRSDYGRHNQGIRNQPPIMSPEGELMHLPSAHMIDDDNEDHQVEQPCSLGCLSSEVLCAQSCMCIPKFQRCDQEINCDGGEDEDACGTITNVEILQNIKKECEASNQHVLCPKTFVCIAKNFLCDGDNDCGDYSDETHCGARINCTEDQFECDNGLCIQRQWVCDSDNDCKDFSDELNCTKQSCSQDEIQCKDKTCISPSSRCDSEPDCPDASDEENCQAPLPDCPEGEFKCRGGSSLSSTPGSRCILNRFRCDSENDCGDWSDEEGCSDVKSITCSSRDFKCGDGNCIPIEWKCDREQDCDGGEDEKSCTDDVKAVKRQCADDEFQCQDGRCILKTWLCDGIADCKRADDEMNCHVPCEVGQFTCPMYKNMSNVRICVSQKHICDGQNDCLQGEDEQNCPKQVQCSAKSKCEQLCVVNSDNQETCACRVGFILADNKQNCTDIDECQYTIDPVCSQKCINTVGSFQCGCTNGYILRPDLRTCKALGGAVKLIMANRVDIRQVSLSNNRYTSIVKGLHNAIALDFHYKKSLLFWSDVSTDVIKMSYMNGTGVHNIIKYGLESPGGIAVDWIHDLIFWTDSGTKRIEVTTFDGSLRAVIIANDLEKPRAIVVHPGEALIFFTDWGNEISLIGGKPSIERAYMDGSDRRTIIADGVHWPNALTIDYSGGRIYWADAKHHVIESSHYDGSDRKKILSNHLPHPFALTLFEDHLYWTDWNTKSISTANKITGKGFRNVHIDLHFPMDIHSYHASRQPNFLNRCPVDRRGLRGGCSHLCLPNKNSRRCGCPIGLTLKDDQKTCSEIPDKLLIISRKKDIRVRQLVSKNSLNEHDMVIPIDGLKTIRAIDWDHKTDSVYWADSGKSSISRAQINGDNQKQIIRTNLISPTGLALDWITEKLYWTDADAKRIEVATTDGRLRTMIIWQGLQNPRDIVVNLIEGIMFWCDWGENPRIETAGMDGSNRRTIVSEHIQFPNGLAIDYAGNRLYFVDSGTNTMETVNFEGNARQIIIEEGLVQPFGIDVYDQRVFWIDNSTLTVESADKGTGRNRKVLISNVSDLTDVCVFHRDRKTISNLCSISNGDCSHMCLLNQTGYKCACPIGVKLSSNGRTCKDGPTDFIILARRTDIRRISLDIDYYVDAVLPLPPMKSTISADVDVVTGDIYWSDTGDDTIMKSTSDGIDYQKMVASSIGNVDALVVDSIGRKIYFTESERISIDVCELNGSNRAPLIYTDLEAPRGIAIDYTEGLLFWTDWLKSRIERAHMDGNERTRIVDKNLGWPNSLAIYAEHLYWTDAKLKRIESCNYDGQQRRILIRDLEHPYGLAITATHIYWCDWRSSALHMLDKRNSSIGPQFVLDNQEGIMDVKVIRREEKLMENVCGLTNRNCSHLCLRNPKGFSCKCPTGLKFKSPNQCYAWPESYMMFAMRSGIGRISLDTDDMFDVVLPIEDIHAAVVVDYHYNSSRIKSVDMSGKYPKSIITSGLKTMNGLAVDWIGNNLYWSDNPSCLIEVARLDGTSRKAIITDDLIDPRYLAVFPQRGYLFFSDWGKPQRIERSFLDGSGRKTLINTNLGFPTGLSVDYVTRRLYWVDALEDRIEVSDLEGRDRKQIVEHTQFPFGAAIFESNLYWTNWFNKSIWKTDKRGHQKAQIVRAGLGGALDIRFVSQSRQPMVWSPCVENNGGCSHLCLYRFTTYVCECPDKSDGRSCTPAEHQVTSRPTNTPDYSEEFIDDSDAADGYSDNNAIARIAIIATAVLGVLLIIVLCAILYLVLNNSSKNNNNIKETDNFTPRSSTTGSVLTFSNPNYNVGAADAELQPEQKGKVWKRMKYDKAQERVWEERCLGESSATVVLMPSGHTSNSSLSRSPLSTIG